MDVSIVWRSHFMKRANILYPEFMGFLFLCWACGRLTLLICANSVYTTYQQSIQTMYRFHGNHIPESCHSSLFPFALILLKSLSSCPRHPTARLYIIQCSENAVRGALCTNHPHTYLHTHQIKCWNMLSKTSIATRLAWSEVAIPKIKQNRSCETIKNYVPANERN